MCRLAESGVVLVASTGENLVVRETFHVARVLCVRVYGMLDVTFVASARPTGILGHIYGINIVIEDRSSSHT